MKGRNKKSVDREKKGCLRERKKGQSDCRCGAKMGEEEAEDENG